MSRFLILLLTVLSISSVAFGQEKTARRTSNVKLQNQIESAKKAEMEAERKQAEQARLEEEKNKEIAEKAKKEALIEASKRESEMKSQLEKSNLEKLEAEKLVAEEKSKLTKLEQEKAQELEKIQNESLSLQNEIKIKTEETERLKNDADRLLKIKEREIEKAKEENLTLQNEVKSKIEAAETSKLEVEKRLLEVEKQKADQEKLLLEKQENTRRQIIEITAKKFNILDINKAFTLIPAEVNDPGEIENILSKTVQLNSTLVKNPSFCDFEFSGEPLNLELTADDNFGSLLQELRMLFGINFLPDSEVIELPVRVNVNNVPWNLVLQTQLNYLDLEARCTAENTIAILKRAKWQNLQNEQKKSAPLVTEFIKLRYLQPTVGGQVDVTGRSSQNGNSLESVENAVNKILKADGDNRGSISRIPGRNEFIITATKDQLSQIKMVIAKADKPSYQVVIYASVVTANENKMRDVGGQFGLIAGTGNLNQLGGTNGFPTTTGGNSGSNSGSGGGGSESNTGALNPGGVRRMGEGFGSPQTGGSVFGLSSIFGTVQLQAQINLLETKGAVKVDNRPSIIVIDGQTADLQIGRNVFVPIQNVGNFGGGNGSLQVLNAANTLNASPQVIEDENGNPVAVNLGIRVESNEVDTSVVSQGVPSVIRRSTQTSLMLNTSQTAIIGGFSTDSETMSDSQTPGLGNIPILGNLFKRKVRSNNQDRLYFAIRVEIVKQGEILNVAPVNISTEPKLPNPNNDFFKPYNQTPEIKKID